MSNFKEYMGANNSAILIDLDLVGAVSDREKDVKVYLTKNIGGYDSINLDKKEYINIKAGLHFK